MHINDEVRRRLDAEINKLMKKASDDGRLIEVGWLSLRLASMAPDAPQSQIDAMRALFFAGAQYLFGSIMNMVESGSEPTDADLRLIHHELEAFITIYSMKHGLPVEPQHGGRA